LDYSSSWPVKDRWQRNTIKSRNPRIFHCSIDLRVGSSMKRSRSDFNEQALSPRMIEQTKSGKPRK